ncbi:MAG TPA: glycoside hydrolase family 71/99-like protein [Verrucomicrobiae bacterium]
MKLRFFCLLLAGYGWLTARSAPPPATTEAKPVLVYYMAWYASAQVSGAWGWHWTMDHFNPGQTNASGEREIASWYYPLIGPYDSADPAVLEYHVLLMKLAGIDGVMVDWYGSADLYDYAVVNRNTLRLFDFTRKAGLKFAICYEDQTLPRLLDGKKLSATDALGHARQEMRYLQEHFFGDPSYFRLGHRPLLENFGPQYFTAATNWDNIFDALEPSNRPAFFTEDNRLNCGLGAFNWPPMWLSQQPGTGGVLSEASLLNYLNDYEKKSLEWPAYISSAFPRFHDIYQRAGARNYWGYLGDRNGETLRETLTRAFTNNSAVVQIVTWNDFGEGTTIEPTKEYGFRDLAVVQQLCHTYSASKTSWQTNDLPLALDFYRLRCLARTETALTPVLDDLFTNLVAGQITAARNQLAGLKAKYQP